ncbi:Interleukin-1 receptor-like 2 [Liparis tanakae]|uniref:Interleukin-1 receptor-like 2 n=1 Tax=Liparis tanakae TaxID=230148 RepID=A0A4Z2F5P0_9TELE|nr:Interleukin-1 receptor-like 2 [Liparis tanakae]
MARPAALTRLLLLLGLQRICGGLKHVAPDVFDFAAVPFSVSWFEPGGGRMSNQSGRVLLAGAALWLLRLQLEDSGDYVTILRTPTGCYRQATRLQVERPAAGCGRPRSSQQTLTDGVTDMLKCPLVAYMEQLQRHHAASQLTWYRVNPGLLLPVGSALGGVTSLFIVSGVLFFLLKVDVVLWFRRTFPDLYASTERDGKRFDAYVAFPPCSPELEAFALQALPRVLEDACGYRLFIAGRDSSPGAAVVDSVEENIQASRRLLLLYTASTFTSRRHTSNNNNNKDKSSEDVYPESQQQLECVILVEMERISPAQLALFPEALRHLRRTQGAVRWWRSPRRCCRGAEPGAGHALCPASSFWKEVRYRMPVRGKRALHPETTALMDL